MPAPHDQEGQHHILHNTYASLMQEQEDSKGSKLQQSPSNEGHEVGEILLQHLTLCR